MNEIPHKYKSASVYHTDVVFLLAGDGVAADLSVLDCRQVPDQKYRHTHTHKVN